MARGKNSVPSIRRLNIAIPLMIVSVAIVALIVLYILDYRSQGLGIFKTQLRTVTESFESVEKTYNGLLTTVLTKRSPVPEFTVNVVEESYDNVLTDITDIEAQFTNPTTIQTLREIIATRKIELQKIRIMNQTLRSEESVGNSLAAYTSCRNAISYKQKASQIVGKLGICKIELDGAYRAVQELPQESLLGCSARHTPSFYIQWVLKTHELFVSSYTYSSKGKAKEAAAAEIEYQRVTDEIKQLPDWNTCITQYLQKTADVLLGE